MANKSPSPGDLLLPSEWIVTKVTTLDRCEGALSFTVTHVLGPGPSFVVAVSKDRQRAYVITETYTGWAQLTKIEVPLNISISDETLMVLTGVVMLLIIVVFSLGLAAVLD